MLDYDTMRLLLTLLLLLTVELTSALGLSCFKVISALASRPNDLFEKFQREICDRGCHPTVAHWDLWTRNHTFVPAVQSVMKKLDAPQQERAMIQLGDEVAIGIKNHCGALLQGKSVCADAHTLAEFGNCFKKSFVKAAMANLATLLPMASESVCREEYAFVKTERFWEEIIPNHMREYASVCHSLEAEAREKTRDKTPQADEAETRETRENEAQREL